MVQPLPKLIHVACIRLPQQGLKYLLLRQINPLHYTWFLEEAPGQEKETPTWGVTTEEALLAARKTWSQQEFRTLNCGFRYTLPERDEVGTNALFHQMVASYASMTGVYFDEELGCNCFVQNASLEARNFAKRLQQTAQL